MDAPPPIPCMTREIIERGCGSRSRTSSDAIVKSTIDARENAAAKVRGETSGHRDDHDARDDVSGGDPRDLVDRGPEVGAIVLIATLTMVESMIAMIEPSMTVNVISATEASWRWANGFCMLIH